MRKTLAKELKNTSNTIEAKGHQKMDMSSVNVLFKERCSPVELVR